MTVITYKINCYTNITKSLTSNRTDLKKLVDSKL